MRLAAGRVPEHPGGMVNPWPLPDAQESPSSRGTVGGMDGAEIAVFVSARLDEDEVAAIEASGPDVSQNGKWVAYGHPPGIRDGRRDRDVQLVGAGPDEKSWTVCEVGQWDRAPMVAAHIARHDPARVLRDIKASRADIALYRYLAAKYDRTRHAADMKRRDALMAVLRNRASIWDDHPDYRPEWKP